ncbi:T9SS type A sorting domain-containing protein [Pontibacter cellulosilyticus]|uniref:T9SS type A sorting domain-containing protein n=1 Tax=Pontibacter cellulosilyticus TaxID=1720253 RepID=A0A923N7V1_9BACT|nr:T9SS type A sorting domain-containing protein [Pontibacter cellulosilyticus]MBC5993387.1 T9SS type A sorting domain-containing protein [Pontibacter cellulosilyticus]
MIKLICTTVFISLATWGNTVLAQSSPVTSGGTASDDDKAITISYSYGQIFYTINSNDELTITTGIQQPQIIIISKGRKDKGSTITAYPNPSTDFFVLHIDSDSYEDISYAIYSSQGSLIVRRTPLVASKVTISTDELQRGNYYLKVFNKDEHIKTLKIVNEK